MNLKRVLMLCPEPPYPLHGGGRMRTASLLEYFAAHGDVDVVIFRDPQERHGPFCFPAGMVRRVLTIQLPAHSRSRLARGSRNIIRALRGVPPLVDRFGGFHAQLARCLGRKSYELAIVEHFWCAPYVDILRRCARRVILDLHNLDSAVLASYAAQESLLRPIYHRLAQRSRALEAQLLPRFDTVLVTCQEDARLVRLLAPCSQVLVYPNAIPFRARPQEPKQQAVAFSGNLEYPPNRLAIQYFHRHIWPQVRAQAPDAQWRIIGRHPEAVPERIRTDASVRLLGAVEDALPHLAGARVAVAPILTGGGTKVKILEAWAAGTAVVSSSAGAAGIPCRSGEHLLIADGPQEFATAVCRLLQDPHWADQLAANGRALYEKTFTWEAAWQALSSLTF